MKNSSVSKAGQSIRIKAGNSLFLYRLLILRIFYIRAVNKESCHVMIEGQNNSVDGELIYDT